MVPLKRLLVTVRVVIEITDDALNFPIGQVSPRLFEKGVKVRIGQIEHAVEPKDVCNLLGTSAIAKGIPVRYRDPRKVERFRQRRRLLRRLVPCRAHLREGEARSDVPHVREHQTRDLFVHVERRSDRSHELRERPSRLQVLRPAFPELVLEPVESLEDEAEGVRGDGDGDGGVDGVDDARARRLGRGRVGSIDPRTLLRPRAHVALRRRGVRVAGRIVRIQFYRPEKNNGASRRRRSSLHRARLSPAAARC